MIDRETIHTLTAQAGVFTYPSQLYPIPSPEEIEQRQMQLNLQLLALKTLKNVIKQFKR